MSDAQNASPNDIMKDLFAAPASTPTASTTVAAMPSTSLGLASQLPALAPKSTAPAELMPTSSLPPEVVAKAEQVAAAVDFMKGTDLLVYGKPGQDALDNLVDSLLRDVKVEDAGIIGDILVQLKTGINSLEIDKIREELNKIAGEESGVKGFFRKMPFVGHAMNHAETFIARKGEMLDLFDAIEVKMNDRMVKIAEGSAKLEMFSANLRSYLQALVIFIVAGQKALALGVAKYETDKAALATSNDSIKFGELRELHGNLVAFDVRVSMLKAAFVNYSTVNALQFLMAREAGKIEIGNIMNVMMFTIPHMKSTMIGVITEIAIKRAQADGKALSDADRKMTESSLALLRDVYLAGKETQGDIKTHVELLAFQSSELEKMIKDGEAIEAKTAEARREANAKLIEVKDKTKKIVLESKGPDVANA